LCDLEGDTIRVWHKYHEVIITALNGKPVQTASSEMYTSLERGVIDGCVTGAGAMLTLSLWENATNYWGVEIPGGICTVVVNIEAFEALPTEYKEIFLEEATHWSQVGIDGVFEDEIKSAEALRANGVEIHELSPEERQCWREAGASIWSEWAEQDPMNQEVLEIVKEKLGL
jgi:TRAP-type C4-dicarboxylate transport system substrate-binding protein